MRALLFRNWTRTPSHTSTTPLIYSGAATQRTLCPTNAHNYSSHTHTYTAVHTVELTFALSIASSNAEFQSSHGRIRVCAVCSAVVFVVPLSCVLCRCTSARWCACVFRVSFVLCAVIRRRKVITISADIAELPPGHNFFVECARCASNTQQP